MEQSEAHVSQRTTGMHSESWLSFQDDQVTPY